MALTNAERKAKTQAALETLIADLATARQNSDAATADKTHQALIAFNSPYPDLNDLAENAAAAATLANMNEALDDLAEVAARLSPFGESLKAAREVARHAKEELVLPKLAATASQAVQIFTTLKASVDKVQAEIAAAGTEGNDWQDAAKALGNVLDELKNLRKTLADLEG